VPPTGRIEWPDEDRPAPRPDWRDTVSAAADLALVGVCVVVAALPVVTAGAALATGSVAARHWVLHREFPPFGELWRGYLRWIPRGAAAAALLVAAGVLVGFDLRALAGGLVPGGRVGLLATAAVVVWAAAVTVLTTVGLGRWPGEGWWAATRWAVSTTIAAPHRAVVPLLVVALAATLGSMVPATSPLAVGYGLFAIHVVADRVLPAPQDPPAAAPPL
jgi:hypothetical protein